MILATLSRSGFPNITGATVRAHWCYGKRAGRHGSTLHQGCPQKAGKERDGKHLNEDAAIAERADDDVDGGAVERQFIAVGRGAAHGDGESVVVQHEVDVEVGEGEAWRRALPSLQELDVLHRTGPFVVGAWRPVNLMFCTERTLLLVVDGGQWVRCRNLMPCTEQV